MTQADYDRWYCSPYISSIALQISEVLKGTDVRVIRRVAEGEGNVLTRVRTLLWMVTIVALLAAALAVGASAAASVLERRTEIGLMKALGAGSGLVGVLLAAEQLLLAFVGGGIGYAVGILFARLLGMRVFGFAPEPKLFVLLHHTRRWRRSSRFWEVRCRCARLRGMNRRRFCVANDGQFFDVLAHCGQADDRELSGDCS